MPTEQALQRNIRCVGQLDIAGGGQIYVAGSFAYVGHMRPPYGTSIIDIEDPTNPRVVAELKLADQRAHSHKVRVVGDIMVTNVEMNDRHAVRRGSGWPAAVSKLRGRLGREPTEDEVLAELTMTREQRVSNRLIAERQSTGPLQTDTFEPSGTGTRYTHTMQYTTRFSPLDTVAKFLVTAGRGLQWGLDDGVEAVKKSLEADLADTPAQR